MRLTLLKLYCAGISRVGSEEEQRVELSVLGRQCASGMPHASCESAC